MKVLQLITGLGQGGAEQVVFDLATRLDAERYEPFVCSVLDPSGARSAYVGRLIEAGVPVASLGITRKWQFRRAVGRLGSLLRDVQPDVLHCHLFHANVLGRRVARAVGLRPVIATVHIAERRRRPWRFWLERRTDPLGCVTVCVSQAVLEFQTRKTGLPRERFVVIPNGIDTVRYERPLRPKGEVRAEWGIGPDAAVVGSVGRLDRQKGYRYLLRAFAERARDTADCVLVVAGEGPERRKLTRLAERLGCAERVHLLGRRTDVPDLLHAFDIFVMSSLYEGLPLALIEAMAAGIPIVASNVDSVPEVLGGGGRLVPPRDPAALASAIAETLARPDADRVERGQNRARSEYDVRVMVRRYAELYDAVMRGERPAGAQTRASQPPSA
jgi:glycosyltransferase involved in cell wall biosynthesis